MSLRAGGLRLCVYFLSKCSLAKAVKSEMGYLFQSPETPELRGDRRWVGCLLYLCPGESRETGSARLPREEQVLT